MKIRTSKYGEEQVNGSLRLAAAGAPINEVCRRHCLSDASFYKRYSTYAAMKASEAKPLCDLKLEKGMLKRLLADAHLDIHAHTSGVDTKR